MKSLINYSKASRLLTGDRTAIRSSYNGVKHKKAITELKEFEEAWILKYAKDTTVEFG